MPPRAVPPVTDRRGTDGGPAVELVVFSMLAFGVLLVLGMLAGVLCMVGWLIALPFRLFGLAIHVVAAFLALPLIALFGILGFLIFGFGTLLLLIPLAP